MPLALTKSATILASASVKTVPSSFQPIMGVTPIIALSCASVLPGKMAFIWSRVALKDVMVACDRVAGDSMVWMLLAPKLCVMALTMLTRTPASTALLTTCSELALTPRNQADKVKEV